MSTKQWRTLLTPPVPGYIREPKFRGQIRHSREKDRGTHGEGWAPGQWASGPQSLGRILLLLPGTDQVLSASVTLMFGKRNCWGRGGGRQNKPPPPPGSATQSRKPSTADFLRVTTPGLKRAGTK